MTVAMQSARCATKAAIGRVAIHPPVGSGYGLIARPAFPSRHQPHRDRTDRGTSHQCQHHPARAFHGCDPCCSGVSQPEFPSLAQADASESPRLHGFVRAFSRRRSACRRSARTNRSRRAAHRWSWIPNRRSSSFPTKSRLRNSCSATNRRPNRRRRRKNAAGNQPVSPSPAGPAGNCCAASVRQRRRRPPACPSPAVRPARSVSLAAKRSAQSEAACACRIRGWACRSSSVDHAGGVERARGQR